MKRLCPILLLFMAIIHFSSCEKDDICVEGDTPLLVIGFYDITDTTFKSVNNLRILSTDNDSILNSTTEYGFTDRSNSPDSISMPLRISETTTTFQFISGSSSDDDGNEIGNIDELQFNYTVESSFVSRACGFVASYIDLDIPREVTEEDWIRSINIIESNITASNRIHVQIFH